MPYARFTAWEPCSILFYMGPGTGLIGAGACCTTAMARETPDGEASRPRPRWAIRAMSGGRSEEHTSELQSLMRISYAAFCLKKKTKHHTACRHKRHTENHKNN